MTNTALPPALALAEELVEAVETIGVDVPDPVRTSVLRAYEIMGITPDADRLIDDIVDQVTLSINSGLGPVSVALVITVAIATCCATQR